MTFRDYRLRTNALHCLCASHRSRSVRGLSDAAPGDLATVAPGYRAGGSGRIVQGKIYDTFAACRLTAITSYRARRVQQKIPVRHGASGFMPTHSRREKLMDSFSGFRVTSR